ncbi:fibronectin type III domain-containing protein [Micromonospora tarensis]|uniref:Cellulose binding domain-containing protein n=1 Tax=Micromonospora tarensis TaxID=2806100 RepID=A0ABS1YL49_9ACTN|nr:cellulose binding domain-containing protein [Micromonospora tarensis]MBM0278163.1 cellulose binding domain-containing protein [Micromonospora tarensis]
MPDRQLRGARFRAAALAACALTATVVATGASPAYAAADTERPSAPGPITVVAIDTTWVELTWAASTDNVGVVRYPVGARFEDTGAHYSTDTTSIRITGLRPSRTYVFSVAAEDAAGNRSLADPTVRLTMPPGDDQPPSAPGQPVAYDVAATLLWLRWAHSVENVALDRYEVFRVDSGGTLTRVSEVYQYPPGRNSTQISGLTPNTTYTFVVQARDEAGQLSELSEPVTVTTLPPPPSCAVRSVLGQWPDGFVARLAVTNTGPTPIDGWTMRWRFYAGQQLRSLWGAEVVDRDSSYLRVRDVRHNGLIPPGGTVSLGVVASGSQTPQEVTLNGGVCVVADE